MLTPRLAADIPDHFLGRVFRTHRFLPYENPSIHPKDADGRQNGYNEGFNGKLRDELLNREIFYSMTEAKVLTEQWHRHYKTIRPHSSLGYRPSVPQSIAPHRGDPPSAAGGLQATLRIGG